jgi:hypothetical protein
VTTGVQIRSAFLLTTVVVACAGCQSTTQMTPPPPTSSRTERGPTLSGTVEISGGATIPSSHFSTDARMDTGQMQIPPPAGSTCADYSDGFQHAPNVVPLSFVGPVVQTSGYHNIYVGVVMSSGYAGPGTYDSAQTPSLSGSAVEGIGIGSSAVYTVFNSRDSGAMTLTVSADGSGTLKLEHWDSDEVRQAPGSSQVNISGVISWKCHG